MAEDIMHALTGSHGFVNILITEEQAQNPEFKKWGKQFYLGFLPYEKVPSYHCDNCDKYHAHSPKIEVHITDLIEDRPNTNVAYRCTECNEIVKVERIESPKGIDKKYITFDESGDWRPPTTEEIEAEMKKAEESAKKGEGCGLASSGYSSHLKRALHWAGKISYDIPQERVERLETTYRSSYLKIYEKELPGLVEAIKDKSWGFSKRVDEHSGISSFEGSFLSEMLPPLYEALPLIDLPEDTELKQDILWILLRHTDMYSKSVEELNKEKRKIEKSIIREKRKLADMIHLKKLYVRKSGLKPEEISESE